MTREELKHINFKQRKYNPKDALFSDEQVLDAMQAAYNQAIEDAIRICYSTTSTGTVYNDLQQLKIK